MCNQSLFAAEALWILQAGEERGFVDTSVPIARKETMSFCYTTDLQIIYE